jgi:WD40 repeat protein
LRGGLTLLVVVQGPKPATAATVPSGIRLQGPSAKADRPGYLEFTPDGRFLYCLERGGGAVAVWDMLSRRLLRVLETGYRGVGPHPVAVHPGGRSIAGVAPDGNISVRGLHQNGPLITLPPPRGYEFKSMRFSTDGQLLAACSSRLPGGELSASKMPPEGAVSIWDTRTWKPMPLRFLESTPSDLAFAPRGGRLFVGFDDDRGEIAVLSPFNRKAFRRIRFATGNESSCHCLAFKPDGTRLAVAAGRLVKVLSADSWVCKNTSRFSSDVTGVTLGKDDKVAAVNEQGGVRIWSSETGRRVYSANEFYGTGGRPTNLAFAPWPGVIAMTTDSDSEGVQLIDALEPDSDRATNTSFLRKIDTLLSGNLTFRQATWDGSHTLLAANGVLEPVTRWHLPTGREARFTGSQGEFVFDASAHRLITSMSDLQQPRIGFWDTTSTTAPAMSLPIEKQAWHQGPLVVSSDGKKITTGSLDGIYCYENGKETKKFRGLYLADPSLQLEQERVIHMGHQSGVDCLRQLDLISGLDGPVPVPASVARWLSARAESAPHVPALVRSLAVSEDGCWLALTLAAGSPNIFIVERATGKLARILPGFKAEALKLSPDGGNLLVAEASRGWLVRLRTSGAPQKVALHGDPSGIAMAFSSDGKLLAAGQEGGHCRLYRVDDATHLADLVQAAGGGVYVTPDMYYAGSPSAIRHLSYVVGERAYPAEDFDLFFNRPDQVLRRLQTIIPVTRETLDLSVGLRKARLRRLGVHDREKFQLATLPKARILNKDFTRASSRIKLQVEGRASSNLAPLQRLHVRVNGVPILGRQGRALGPFTRYHGELDVALCAGTNRIEVACEDSRGRFSPTETLVVSNRAARPAAYKRFILTVGVSDYKNPSLSLRYSAKDARDVVACLAAGGGREQVKTLCNEAATREKILALRAWLSQSEVDDEVILFFSGHGFLAGDQYCYGTYDVDPANPLARGLSYNDLLDMLDGISARKRLILMDTCHAGELEPTAVEPHLASGVTARSIAVPGTPWTKQTSRSGTVDPLRACQEVFVDLRHGSGATILAAAGGAEFAYEKDSLQNGVFTYVLKDATTRESSSRRRADAGGDNGIDIQELRVYLLERVSALTGGLQLPISRELNENSGFKITNY